MPVNTYELVKAISVVTDNANVRVSVKRSAKGAIVCGAICFAGGILLGPVGLAIGGTVGGLTAYQMTKGINAVSYFDCKDIDILKQCLAIKNVSCCFLFCNREATMRKKKN